MQVLINLNNNRRRPREDNRTGRSSKRKRRTCDQVAPLDAKTKKSKCEGSCAARARQNVAGVEILRKLLLELTDFCLAMRSAVISKKAPTLNGSQRSDFVAAT